MEKHRILIIEDEKQISRFLELELTHEGYEVVSEPDGRAGLERIEQGGYDLVLLDVMLPGISGMEVCRRSRQLSEVPIIMLTARDDVTSKVMGLDLGAEDYITKPFAIEELLARIRVILRRRTVSQPHRLQYAELQMDLDSRRVTRAEAVIELTRKEYELLEYLLKNKEIVLSREQILERVWGYDFSGDTNVVDVYIKYLRAKIDDPYPRKYIHTVRGFGYVLKGGAS